MKKVFFVLSLCFMLAACNSIPSMLVNNSHNMDINAVAPYPDAEPGYRRFVIYLPVLNKEQDYKVELIIGKDILSDCNQKKLMGKIKKRTISGWGYDYYVVESKDGAVSTLKACPSNQETVNFAVIPNNVKLINYNSRLPIVVYTPSDLQVRYRIWSISDEVLSAIRQ